MRRSFAPLAFAAGATALVIRDQQCVQLKASGPASGTLGQLSDGQNRIGGGYGAACYCLSNGGFMDTSGRGCILTPPTTQFQCDVGAKPTTGFAIGSSGSVTYNGNGKFYACPATDNGEYNVYSQPVAGQTKCVEISLSSGGACGNAPPQSTPAPPPPAKSTPAPPPPVKSTPAPPPPPPPAKSTPAPPPPPPVKSTPAPPPPPPPAKSTPAPPPPPPPAKSTPAPPPPPAKSTPAPPPPPPPAKSTPAPPPPSPPAQSTPAPPAPPAKSTPAPPPPAASGCPPDLSGSYQYPHLIVPISSTSPNKGYGTSYFGSANSATCSIFNFDIPASYSGQTCTVVFLFPDQAHLTTSSYTVSGSGGLDFSSCSSPAKQDTTWSSAPSCQATMHVDAMPGNSYTVASGACQAGQTVSYKMCAGGDYSLNYFQDYNPSPIGMYVRAC